jgi:phage tail-like protein
MRGTTTALGTPYPLGTLLPAVLQEDAFLMRFTGAVDALLAPAIAALDSLSGYVDPALAPPDFLNWLAGWVGIELDETWTVAQQRDAISRAVALHRGRGTVAGLREQLELVSGGEVEIIDSGGVSWSLEPVEGSVGELSAMVEVVVRGTAMSPTTLNGIVEAAKPAHVAHQLRIEP